MEFAMVMHRAETTIYITLTQLFTKIKDIHRTNNCKMRKEPFSY